MKLLKDVRPPNRDVKEKWDSGPKGMGPEGRECAGEGEGVVPQAARLHVSWMKVQMRIMHFRKESLWRKKKICCLMKLDVLIAAFKLCSEVWGLISDIFRKIKSLKN